MILLVDEYSQLVGTHKEVEGLIVQLGQMARAAGIHVILATQSPRSTVVTGIIKANFPSRVCLMVASDLESRIVLDEGGGESLSPKGDMLIKLVDGSMVRAQELTSVTKKLKQSSITLEILCQNQNMLITEQS